MNHLVIDARKILNKDVQDFSKFDHSMFNFDSLKRILFILSKRKADVYFVNFPDGADLDDLIVFWIDNCYPGHIVKCLDDINGLFYQNDEYDIEPLCKKEDYAWSIISYGEATPVTDKDVKLAIYNLKP